MIEEAFAQAAPTRRAPRADQAGRAPLARGLDRGDAVTMLASSVPETLIVQRAAQFIGCRTALLYANLSTADQCLVNRLSPVMPANAAFYASRVSCPAKRASAAQQRTSGKENWGIADQE